MYPELFSIPRLFTIPEMFGIGPVPIGPVTVYTYGVLLAASYLLGLRLAMSRAKRWGLDSNRVLDLGIYIIIAALVGAKLLLLFTDFDQFRSSPAELPFAGAVGGRFLRWPHPRRGRRILVHRQAPLPCLDDLRCVRAGHRPRPRDGRLDAWLRAAATADPPMSPGRSCSTTRWRWPTWERRSAFRFTLLSSTKLEQSCRSWCCS